MIQQLYKMKDKYQLQSWYNTDYHILMKVNKDRFMWDFGTDCVFCNIQTGEIISRWDRNFEKVSEEENKRYWRNHILKNVLKEKV